MTPNSRLRPEQGSNAFRLDDGSLFAPDVVLVSRRATHRQFPIFADDRWQLIARLMKSVRWQAVGI